MKNGLQAWLDDNEIPNDYDDEHNSRAHKNAAMSGGGSLTMPDADEMPDMALVLLAKAEASMMSNEPSEEDDEVEKSYDKARQFAEGANYESGDNDKEGGDDKDAKPNPFDKDGAKDKGDDETSEGDAEDDDSKEGESEEAEAKGDDKDDDKDAKPNPFAKGGLEAWLVKAEKTKTDRSGEGSRGGVVIGHRSNGTPIYQKKDEKKKKPGSVGPGPGMTLSEKRARQEYANLHDEASLAYEAHQKDPSPETRNAVNRQGQAAYEQALEIGDANQADIHATSMFRATGHDAASAAHQNNKDKALAADAAYSKRTHGRPEHMDAIEAQQKAFESASALGDGNAMEFHREKLTALGGEPSSETYATPHQMVTIKRIKGAVDAARPTSTEGSDGDRKAISLATTYASVALAARAAGDGAAMRKWSDKATRAAGKSIDSKLKNQMRVLANMTGDLERQNASEAADPRISSPVDVPDLWPSHVDMNRRGETIKNQERVVMPTTMDALNDPDRPTADHMPRVVDSLVDNYRGVANEAKNNGDYEQAMVYLDRAGVIADKHGRTEQRAKVDRLQRHVQRQAAEERAAKNKRIADTKAAYEEASSAGNLGQADELRAQLKGMGQPIKGEKSNASTPRTPTEGKKQGDLFSKATNMEKTALDSWLEKALPGSSKEGEGSDPKNLPSGTRQGMDERGGYAGSVDVSRPEEGAAVDGKGKASSGGGHGPKKDMASTASNRGEGKLDRLSEDDPASETATKSRDGLIEQNGTGEAGAFGNLVAGSPEGHGTAKKASNPSTGGGGIQEGAKYGGPHTGPVPGDNKKSGGRLAEGTTTNVGTSSPAVSSHPATGANGIGESRGMGGVQGGSMATTSSPSTGKAGIPSVSKDRTETLDLSKSFRHEIEGLMRSDPTIQKAHAIREAAIKVLRARQEAVVHIPTGPSDDMNKALTPVASVGGSTFVRNGVSYSNVEDLQMAHALDKSDGFWTGPAPGFGARQTTSCGACNRPMFKSLAVCPTCGDDGLSKSVEAPALEIDAVNSRPGLRPTSPPAVTFGHDGKIKR